MVAADERKVWNSSRKVPKAVVYLEVFGGWYMLKTVRVEEGSLRVIEEYSNDLKVADGLMVNGVGSLIRKADPPPKILSEPTFLVVRGKLVRV